MAPSLSLLLRKRDESGIGAQVFLTGDCLPS